MSEVSTIRVLQYIGSLNHGGAQSAIMNLYRHLDKTSFQFDFVSHRPHENQLQNEIESMGGHVFYLDPLNGANIGQFRASWRNFFKAHPEYEIIHSHMRSTASIVVPLAKQAGLATIVHSHSTSNGTGFKAKVKDTLQFPIRHQTDYMLGCSSEAGEWLFGEKACKSDRYLYLPNAIEPKRYAFNQEKRKACRNEFRLNDDPVFGHVGRLHEAKNHEFLIRVFAGLKEKYPKAHLLLVGDGSLRDSIERQIHDLGLTGSVVLAGDQSDITPFLCAMDCFLFPSKWEGLPVTVIEALASGLPCYVSNTITQDINIDSAVHRLSIDDSSIWVNKIELSERIDAMQSIKNNGFDIQDSVKKLEVLYSEASYLAGQRRARS